MDIDRRDLLAGLFGGVVAGGGASATQELAGRIDVHHHFAAPAHLAFDPRFFGEAFGEGGGSRDAGEGADLSILSPFAPPAGPDPRGAARAVNLLGARLVGERPGRLLLFAALPWPDLDGCLTELEHGMDRLGAVGAVIYLRGGSPVLGDPAFEPLYRELDRRRAVVFVHPHSPNCCANHVWGAPDPLGEYGTAAAEAIANLIANGVTARRPKIRFVFAQGSGVAPFVLARLGGSGAAVLGRAPGIYFDTAQMADPAALALLRRVVPPSRILYGADYGYRTADDSRKAVAGGGVFTPREMHGVFQANALGLLSCRTG